MVNSALKLGKYYILMCMSVFSSHAHHHHTQTHLHAHNTQHKHSKILLVKSAVKYVWTKNEKINEKCENSFDVMSYKLN